MNDSRLVHLCGVATLMDAARRAALREKHQPMGRVCQCFVSSALSCDALDLLTALDADAAEKAVPACVDCATTLSPGSQSYTPCVRHGGGEHGVPPAHISLGGMTRGSTGNGAPSRPRPAWRRRRESSPPC